MASPFIEIEVGERLVKVTNPDKVLFPAAGHTKRDLVEYYLSVGEGIVDKVPAPTLGEPRRHRRGPAMQRDVLASAHAHPQL